MTSDSSEFSEIGVESLMELESSEFSKMGENRFVPNEDLEDASDTNGRQFAALNRYSDDRADFLNSEDNSVQIVADAEDSNLKEIDQTDAASAGSNSFHAGKVKGVMCNSDHHVELPDSDENLRNAAIVKESNACDGAEVKVGSGVSCEENLDPAVSSCFDNFDMAAIVAEPNCNDGKLKMLTGDSENNENRDRSFIFIGNFKIKLGTGELLINNDKTVSINAYYCEEKRVAEAPQSTGEEETNSNGLMEEDKETEIENEMITEMESGTMVAEEHESKTSVKNYQHCDFASTDAKQAELEFDTEISIPNKGELFPQVKNNIGVEGDNEHQPIIVVQTLLNEAELFAEAEDKFNVHGISTRVESGKMIVEEHKSNTVTKNDQYCDFACTDAKVRHESELESDVEIGVPSEEEPYVQVKNSVGVEVDNEHQPIIVTQTLLNELDFSAEAEDKFNVHAISIRVKSGTIIAEEHESNTVAENDQYCDFAGRDAEARHQTELEFDTEIGVPIERETSVQVKNSVRVEGDNGHLPMMISQTVLNGAELSANVEDNFSVHAISTRVESGTLAAEEHESNTVVENDQHCDFVGTELKARQQTKLESNPEISIPSEREPSVQVKNSVGVKEDNEHYPMTIAQTVLHEAELSAEVENNFSVQTISTHKEDEDEDEDSEVVESCVVNEQAEDLVGIPTPPFEPADSPVDAKRLEAHSIIRQPCYMVRVPNFFDEQLKTNMEDARSQLDEKAQRRDSIRAEVKKKKAVYGECREKFIAVKDDEKAAKDAVSAKRKELDSVLSMINHVIKASSIDDINHKISEREHKIQHNTMPLWQEKQYLREIKQMKQNRRQLRDQLFEAELSEAELNDIVDNKEQLEEQFKTLKTELESLRAVVLSTERNSKAAWSKCDDEFQVLKDMQKKLRIADSDYQEVYEYMQHLRRKITKRNSYFNIDKDDQSIAINYATVGDSEALLNHYENQVENVMHLFNTDEEFRQEYIKSNMKSTVRRLGSLDGRSFGPDAKLPVLPSSYGISSSVVLPSPKGNSSTPILTLDLEIKEKISGAIADGEHLDQTNQADNQTEEEIILQKEEDGDRKEEELTKKVEELERKNEELRKAQAASELKEQLRLEQKAKAKEAEERKRRQVEKAKAKAQYDARNEAELREKEEKIGGSKYATNKKVEGDNVHVDTAPSLFDPDNEPEALAKEPESSNKKTHQNSSRTQAHVKQFNKIEPLPLPLRDRGKRKMTTSMWFFLIILLVVILFLAGPAFQFPI